MSNLNPNEFETAKQRDVPREAGASRSTMLHEIFRKEALDDARHAFGSPVKPIGVAGWVLTLFLAAVLVTVLVFLITARYARKETVLGQITPTEGAFRITSQLNGTAEKVLVREGQAVKEGDELISVSSNPILRSGESLAEGLMAIQATQRRAQEMQARARLQQLEQQIEELNARRDGLILDVARLGDAGKLLEKRRQLQRQTLEAHRSLAKKGMVSPAFIRQQQDALLAIEQQLQQSAREAGLQRSQLAQVGPQIKRLFAEADFVRSEATSLNAQLHERALNSEAQHSGHLVAPIAGIVTALQARAGTPVIAGQTLAVIIPTAAMTSNVQIEVELWAPSKAVGFVKPGAKVRIMYDAFPYQTFGVGLGVVRDVSGTPVSPAELPVPIDTREKLFRIRVSLDRTSLEAYGRGWALVPGMRLSADLILEEQSLLEWILGPVRAARKRAI